MFGHRIFKLKERTIHLKILLYLEIPVVCEFSCNKFNDFQFLIWLINSDRVRFDSEKSTRIYLVVVNDTYDNAQLHCWKCLDSKIYIHRVKHFERERRVSESLEVSIELSIFSFLSNIVSYTTKLIWFMECFVLKICFVKSLCMQYCK